MQFELRHKHLPTKRGILLEKEGRFSEVSPLPGRSHETLEEAIEQLEAVQSGWKGTLFPSVEFGLYGLTCPQITSIPCALFLCGTPAEVMKTFEKPHGCTVAKLKVGSWSVEETLDVIQALPIRLRLDFNRPNPLWNDNKILELCSKLSPSQIEFLEDCGCTVPGFTQASDAHQDASSITVWKPMVRGVRGIPATPCNVILSSSLESSIGLHQIAALMQTHPIPDHGLGIGTVLNLEQDLVQNSATLKEGRLHFPSTWVLC
jgi:O-succinylbenzoate synthase